ncbi:heavy metal translocating P-type ATPase [Corynebacterium nuruki]|uniref:heavy metal translocating P-type ATPase n=1 Tax=Corynebacterium nuruki TaxID=1032851 RepID=UPI0039BF1C2E
MTEVVDDRRGGGAVGTPVPHRVELSVTGMSCAACAARVERRLNKLPEVSASVNYATRTAVVSASPGASVDALCAEVEKAGYAASPKDPVVAEAGDEDADTARLLFRRLIVAVALFIPVADLSILFSVMPSARFTGWQWLLLVLAAPVVLWCAYPMHRACWRGLRHGSTSMDTLVSTGIITASAWSVYSMLTMDDQRTTTGVWDAVTNVDTLYFEVACGVTVFILAGRYFEARAKSTAGRAMRSLAGMVPGEVEVLLRDGGTMTIPTGELKVGQRFTVRPGQRVAADGRVVDGSAGVDTSAMTGESRPVTVRPGDRVTGGTVATDGWLLVEATDVGEDTRLAGMIRLVDEAQQEKGSTQRLADRISAVFVPCVMVLAVGTGLVWFLTGTDATEAVTNAIAVLIIACPCALGLAIPMALMVATGRGAELGIFVKGTGAFDVSRSVDTVIFDKTGTLTTGQPTVEFFRVVDSFDGGEELDGTDLLAAAAAVEDASGHPVSRAVVRRYRELHGDTPLPEITEFHASHGQGVGATVNGHRVQVGSTAWLCTGQSLPPDHLADAERIRRQGGTFIVVAVDGRPVAGIGVVDEPRASAASAVEQLQARGIHCMMLTGDDPVTARALAAQVGIDWPDDVIAGVLPADKVGTVRRIRSTGARAAMVGDGVNDAPALAAADLGLAVGTGTDVAQDAADIIVVRDDLTTVVDALGLARATGRTIRGNLVWAFGYNVAAIPLAMSGLLNPLVASLAMAFSSLFVVGNSLRLRRVGGHPSPERPSPENPEVATWG